MRDSRLSCGELRDDGTGTMVAFGTALRAEWRELRRLLGRERMVLRDAEREWFIEVDADVGWESRLGELGLAGGSMRFTFISDGDIDLHVSTSVMMGVFVERVNEGCRARHVTDAIGKVQKHITGMCLDNHPCSSGASIHVPVPVLVLQSVAVLQCCSSCILVIRLGLTSIGGRLHPD